jgi:hypothetical protein
LFIEQPRNEGTKFSRLRYLIAWLLNRRAGFGGLIFQPRNTRTTRNGNLRTRGTRPAGIEVVSAGIAVVPAGTKTMPVGLQTWPVGTEAIPVGSLAVPAGTETIPTGNAMIPGRMAAIPLGTGGIQTGTEPPPMAC